MIDSDSNNPHPEMRDYRRRGSEHIGDMFLDGVDHWLDRLVERQADFADGISDRQQELVAQRVGEEYTAPVLALLPELAINNLMRRAVEEQRSLIGAGADVDPDILRTYLGLAGEIDRLGEYIAWLDTLAIRGGKRSYEVSSAGNIQEHTFIDMVKGIAFELGGCFELGDLSHQDGIRAIKLQLPQALLAAGFEYKQPDAEDRATILPLKDKDEKGNNRPPMAVVTIDSPVSDVHKTVDGVKHELHVTQRSEKLVLFPNLPQTIQDAVKQVASQTLGRTDTDVLSIEDVRIIAKGTEDERQELRKRIEEENQKKRSAVEMLGRHALLDVDSPAVIPVSTVLYARQYRASQVAG